MPATVAPAGREMPMSRATDGKRHEVTLQYGSGNDAVFIQAVCICEKLNTPPRFSRTRAEEDGRDHLYAAQRHGRPSTGKREEVDPWASAKARRSG